MLETTANQNHDFVTGLYLNVLKRTPKESEVQYWVTQLQLQIMTRNYVLSHFNAVCSSGQEACGETQSTTVQNCSLNGRQIIHGASITTYYNTVVPNGSTCQAYTRACNNGSLSGPSGAVYENGTVQAPIELSDADFLKALYLTILMRNPTASEVQYYVVQIQNGSMSRNHVQVHFYSVCANGQELCGR